jgi:hypothetical protein
VRKRLPGLTVGATVVVLFRRLPYQAADAPESFDTCQSLRTASAIPWTAEARRLGRVRAMNVSTNLLESIPAA